MENSSEKFISECLKMKRGYLKSCNQNIFFRLLESQYTELSD